MLRLLFTMSCLIFCNLYSADAGIEMADVVIDINAPVTARTPLLQGTTSIQYTNENNSLADCSLHQQEAPVEADRASAIRTFRRREGWLLLAQVCTGVAELVVAHNPVSIEHTWPLVTLCGASALAMCWNANQMRKERTFLKEVRQAGYRYIPRWLGSINILSLSAGMLLEKSYPMTAYNLLMAGGTVGTIFDMARSSYNAGGYQLYKDHKADDFF